jgi:hypothetical protein
MEEKRQLQAVLLEYEATISQLIQGTASPLPDLPAIRECWTNHFAAQPAASAPSAKELELLLARLAESEKCAQELAAQVELLTKVQPSALIHYHHQFLKGKKKRPALANGFLCCSSPRLRCSSASRRL